MKSFLARASVVLVLACSSVPLLGAQQARATRAIPVQPQVLILGTYHMGGSSDYIQVSADDVLSPRRQREIGVLVDALAAFRPTKIMVEAPLTRDSALNMRYRRYAAGQDTLRPNEIDQIGFRLAKRSGHGRVYAIDYPQDEDIRRVVGWAAQNGDTGFVNSVQRFGARMRARGDSLPRFTVTEYLRRLNSPAEDALGQSAYLGMARVGRDTAYIGADVVAGRYARNLKIFANLARLTEPGDRVLVIYGANHGKLLRDFVRESPNLELVSTERYLAPRGAVRERR